MSGDPGDLAAALARLEALRGEALALIGAPADHEPASPAAPALGDSPQAPGDPAADLAALRACAAAVVAIGHQVQSHLDALGGTDAAPLADAERASLLAEIARRDEVLRRIGALVAGVTPPAGAPPRPGTGADAADLDLDDLVARIEALQRRGGAG